MNRVMMLAEHASLQKKTTTTTFHRRWMLRLFCAVLTPLAAQAFVVSPSCSRRFTGANSWLPFSSLESSQGRMGKRRLVSAVDLERIDGDRGTFAADPRYNVSLLLIDHYDSFTYNLYDMLAQLTIEPPVVVAKDFMTNVDPTLFDSFDGIVLSPGPGTPHEQPPLSHMAITENPDLPVLGVCLGHQLMALAYGADVDRAPVPIHGQDHWIVQEQQQQQQQQEEESILMPPPSTTQYPSIFNDLPSSFRVVRYHSLAIVESQESSLSAKNDKLIVTARSQDGVIQGIQHKSHPHYGVQFHPESIGTQNGMGLLENFVRVVRQRKEDKGDDAARENASLVDGAANSRLMPKPTFHSRQQPEMAIKTSSRKANRVSGGTAPGATGKSDAVQKSSALPSVSVKPPRFRVMMQQLSSASIQPIQVFEKYYAHQSHSVWLDSSSYPSRGELDILAAPLRLDDDILEYHQQCDQKDILTHLEEELFGGPSNGQKQSYGPSTSIGWVSTTSSEQGTVDEPVVEWVDESNVWGNSDAKLPPFHYRGGFLGFLGYEVRHDTQRYLQQEERGDVGDATQTKENVSKPNGIPTAAFFLARQSMAYHHPTESWYLIGLVEEEEDIKVNLEWMNAINKDFKGWVATESLRAKIHNSDQQAMSTKRSLVEFIPNRPKEVYENDIESCHEFIKKGESYELCLTNQLEANISDSRKSSFDLYKILRRGNPSPYAAYFRWNVPSDYGTSQRKDIPSKSSLVICSSSPERFMSVTRQQPHPEVALSLQCEAKPIKGTCARVVPEDGICRTDAEAREDERRARSLELSLKNRAENLMIVDLLRNDMSRVCKTGTVHVAKLMDIESFATVHQMVSTIRGTLSNTCTSIDLLRASFPGGSMTGAPKIRTMELLEELEQNVDRGPYSGSLGYLSVNGCMDMNIIIRSAVMTLSENEDAWKVSIGAGGAITALSEVEDEYDEMKLKARAVVGAVQEWATLSDQTKDEIGLHVETVRNSTTVGQS